MTRHLTLALFAAVLAGCTGSVPRPGGLAVQALRAPMQAAAGTQWLWLDGVKVAVAANRQVTPNGIWRPKIVDDEIEPGRFDMEVVFLGKVPALSSGFNPDIEMVGATVVLRQDPDGTGENDRIWLLQNQLPEVFRLRLDETSGRLTGSLKGTLTGVGSAKGKTKTIVYAFDMPYSPK